jgi:diguanylate cyclase
MQRWLCELFSDGPQEPEAIYKHQAISARHAAHPVPRAGDARCAHPKHAIHGHLVNLPRARRAGKATNFVAETIELALDAMTDYFVIDMEKQTRRMKPTHVRAGTEYAGASGSARQSGMGAADFAQTAGRWRHGGIAGHQAFNSACGCNTRRRSFRVRAELEQIRLRIEEVENRCSGYCRVAPQSRRCKHADEEISGSPRSVSLEGCSTVSSKESGRDALTRLLNRRFLPAVLTRKCVARRSSVPFALLLLDLDHFKINDTYGHAAGDMVLQQAADLVVSSVRAGDFVFRYGGEKC